MPPGRHHLVAHLVGAPLLQQHRRPAYGSDHEPARDVPRYALPYTGLYQGVGEERDVGRSGTVEGRRRVEEAFWQLLNFAYVAEDIHDRGQRRAASLVRGDYGGAESHRSAHVRHHAQDRRPLRQALRDARDRDTGGDARDGLVIVL